MKISACSGVLRRDAARLAGRLALRLLPLLLLLPLLWGRDRVRPDTSWLLESHGLACCGESQVLQSGQRRLCELAARRPVLALARRTGAAEARCALGLAT